MSEELQKILISHSAGYNTDMHKKLNLYVPYCIQYYFNIIRTLILISIFLKIHCKT